MKYQLFLLLLACAGFMFTCTQVNDDLTDGVCFGFDERQCGVDPFSKTGNNAAKTAAAKLFIEENGIQVLDIDFIENYYEAVCEACEVCPEAYRFIITIPEDKSEQIMTLGLFNISKEGC